MAPDEKAPPYEFVRGTTGNEGSTPAEKLEDHEFEFNGEIPTNIDHRPKNVIIFGQTGVGKSSVVNLLAGRDVANISSSLKACTLEAKAYSFTFSGQMINLFDTVGLEEPEIGVNSFFGAIAKAHQLIKYLHRSGGVDLLIFCIHAGRVTVTTQQNYRLFFEFLCGGKVPVAIVATNLEQEDKMEDWWTRNEEMLDKYGIRSVAHACVTAVRSDVHLYAQKRAESRKAIRMMLPTALGNSHTSYVQEKRTWVGAVIGGLGSLLSKGWTQKSVKKDVSTRLEKDCGLPRDDADKLAEMLTGK